MAANYHVCAVVDTVGVGAFTVASMDSSIRMGRSGRYDGCQHEFVGDG